MSGKFTNAKQLFDSKPMSRRRHVQLSLARSAIAKQVTVGDETERAGLNMIRMLHQTKEHIYIKNADLED